MNDLASLEPFQIFGICLLVVLGLIAFAGIIREASRFHKVRKEAGEIDRRLCLQEEEYRQAEAKRLRGLSTEELQREALIRSVERGGSL